MFNAFWWLLAVEVIGLAAFPLAFFLFPALKDRGYTASKTLGILLLGYASWLLSQLHVLPSVGASIWGLLFVMGGLSAWYAWVHRVEMLEFIRRERLTLAAGEVVFLAFFVGWVIYRAYDPSINHTEQPMDFAFLNASIRADIGTPEDPWLRGEGISYYYFGYWMMGVITQLTAIPSNYSYNLSLALVPALGAMGLFGLIYSVVLSETKRTGMALAGGLSSAFLLVIAANLESVLEFMRANAMGSASFWEWAGIEGLRGGSPVASSGWMPGEFWWWFRATRVINTFDGGQGIDYTIQEFPFFSFMLGDLHPHVMAIPFAILFLSFCWNFLRTPNRVWGRLLRSATEASSSDAQPNSNVGSPALYSYASIGAMGLALGGLAFTNMWDLPTFAALFLGVAALKTYSAQGGDVWILVKGVVPIGAAVIAIAVVLFLPYYLAFDAGVSGIAPVTAATTRPIHLLIVWGLFLVAVIPFVIGAFSQTIVKDDWRRLTVIGLLAGFLPFLSWAYLLLQNGGFSAGLFGRFLHVFPFALLITMAVYSALWEAKWRRLSGRSFALALAALGLLLIMGPELLFVDDSFGPPSERMNTVFKLYYQAWVLLAAASGFAIYYWRSLIHGLSGWKRLFSYSLAVVFLMLVAGSLYYPAAAPASKAGPFNREPTLDGLDFVALHLPAEYEAIQFVKQNVPRDSAILEAVGEWFDSGLISRSTGVPTVINWPGHELQWRGSSAKFDGREQDVARIYQTQEADEARNLLNDYSVDYVYVGPREKEKYGTEGLAKFSAFMDTVFSLGDVTIYQVIS